jgi:hypothetical protein
VGVNPLQQIAAGDSTGGAETVDHVPLGSHNAPSSAMPTLYIETSIVSYLRQRPSSQVVMAARQLLTHRWWNEERGYYELVTSEFVIDEASAGDPVLAQERLDALKGIPLLPFEPQIEIISDEIMDRAILPPKASVDSVHIAVTAFHGIEYLMTWNCRHLANARILPRIHKVL